LGLVITVDEIAIGFYLRVHATGKVYGLRAPRTRTDEQELRLADDEDELRKLV
jgi:hypothetical protein